MYRKQGMSGWLKLLIFILVLALVLAVKWLITASCLNMNFVDYVKDVVCKAMQNFWEAIKMLYKAPIA